MKDEPEPESKPEPEPEPPEHELFTGFTELELILAVFFAVFITGILGVLICIYTRL